MLYTNNLHNIINQLYSNKNNKGTKKLKKYWKNIQLSWVQIQSLGMGFRKLYSNQLHICFGTCPDVLVCEYTCSRNIHVATSLWPPDLLVDFLKTEMNSW